MKEATDFRERYRTGDTPWDAGMPDFNLVETVKGYPVSICKALDIGCGTGDNAVWLAQQGFEVTGVDLSDLALNRAQAKAVAAGVSCSFASADFLRDRVAGGPFGFVFDRGCFHCFDTAPERRRFAANVAGLLGEEGLWLSLAGNADEPSDGSGPPRLTALDIVEAVESCFEVLSLATTRFGSDKAQPPRAWRCLMRKRRPS